jgi:protoheme IX farnesyltransferase
MTTLRALVELTKPRITSLVVLTAWLGFSLAAPGQSFGRNWWLTIIGTALVSAGASALNEYLERDLDARMRRTQTRPLPENRLTPELALGFGVLLSIGGMALLFFRLNPLTAFLAAVSEASYLFLYTPLKTRTALCTLVGAIPGAIPPMMGWTGARGSLAPAAWVLFAILFLWQLPHFLAIAWMYREDYARAGFPMLPVVDPEGGSTARMIVLYTTMLIPVTLLPARIGLTGSSYFYGALGLGVAFLIFGAITAFFRTPAHARRLLLASVFYLPALLTWMVLAA